MIALAQRLWGGNLGHARKALRPLAGILPSLLPESGGDQDRIGDLHARWLRRRPPRPGSPGWGYLTEQRALPSALLADAARRGLVREGLHGTNWFLHQVSGRPVGWEMRGPEYKGFVAGGSKTAFVLAECEAPARIIVCESAIDALSLAVLDGLDDATAYVSTGGGWGDGGRAAITGLVRRTAVLIAATDRGIAGEKLAERLEHLARDIGVHFERRRPEAKDWNDQLVAAARMCREPSRFLATHSG